MLAVCSRAPSRAKCAFISQRQSPPKTPATLKSGGAGGPRHYGSFWRMCVYFANTGYQFQPSSSAIKGAAPETPGDVDRVWIRPFRGRSYQSGMWVEFRHGSFAAGPVRKMLGRASTRPKRGGHKVFKKCTLARHKVPKCKLARHKVPKM